MAPLLFLVYGLQALLYLTYAPIELARDINMLLGVGLLALVVGFCIYDRHHRIILHKRFLEIGLSWQSRKSQILFEKILGIEIKNHRFGFGDLWIHTEDGEIIKLYHIDAPELFWPMVERQRKLSLWG
jgi:hypothetical protein